MSFARALMTRSSGRSLDTWIHLSTASVGIYARTWVVADMTEPGLWQMWHHPNCHYPCATSLTVITYVPPPHCHYLCDTTPTVTTYVPPPHCHYLCATTSLSLPICHHLTVTTHVPPPHCHYLCATTSLPQPMRQEHIQTKYKYTRHILRFCKG